MAVIDLPVDSIKQTMFLEEDPKGNLSFKVKLETIKAEDKSEDNNGKTHS